MTVEQAQESDNSSGAIQLSFHAYGTKIVSQSEVNFNMLSGRIVHWAVVSRMTVITVEDFSEHWKNSSLIALANRPISGLSTKGNPP